jgi:hypothetical protein
LLKPKLVACLFFFFLLASCFAIEASLNENLFFPGDEMVFTLQAAPGSVIGGGTLYEDKVIEGGLVRLDETGFKVIERTVTLLDVPGDYARVFKDLATSEVVKVNFSVQPKKPAALSLSLLEPRAPLIKNKPFNLSVKVLKAGLPLDNALVFTWDAEGKRIQLVEEGQGVYSTDYLVQAVSGTRDFPLKFYAVESDGAEGDWGLEEFSLDIKQVDIGIELIRPLNQVYDYDQPFEAIFRIDYPEELGQPVIKLNDGPYTIDLVQGEDDFYPVRFTGFQALGSEGRPIDFSIIVYDSFGNRLEKEFSFAQEGYFFWFWKTRIMYVIFPAVFLLYLSFLVVDKFLKYKRKRGKSKRKSRKD